MGVDLAPDEVAFRCNLVTVDAAGTMVDFAAGHITSEQSHPIVAALERELGGGRDGVRFHPGVEYRHLCVAPADWADADCVPPHDLTGQPAVWPTGPAAAEAPGAHGRVAARRARRGRARSTRSPPRSGCGARASRRSCPASPTASASRAGSARRSTSSAASACSPGSTSSTCPARPPASTTTTRASSRRASASLADRDFFLLHVEATDEAGHQNAVAEKVAELERWDAEIIGPLVAALDGEAVPGAPPARPRHAVRVDDPHVRPGAVPPVRLDRRRARAASYTESGVADRPVVVAHDLMARLVA